MNSDACMSYSKVQSQTRGGFTSRRGQARTYLRGLLATSRGGRRDSSSSRETTRSSPRAWSRVKEFHGFQDHGVPQVNPLSTVPRSKLSFLPKCHPVINALYHMLANGGTPSLNANVIKKQFTWFTTQRSKSALLRHLK